MTKTTTESALNLLAQVVGHEHLKIDAETRALYSQDVWAKGDLADFVISPGGAADLVSALKIANKAGIALNPRGGGMSYTNGYTPSVKGVGIVDFGRMNKIVEINTDDMYVTVEAGCTWKTLHEALVPLGVRTPAWGPLSGILSTIGGGLSQNNAFFGSGPNGSSSSSVLSLTVVLADGRVIETGTAGTVGGTPFWRDYGPDLTGLFLGDAGALGFKATATLRLIPRPPHEDWASFEFASSSDWAKAQASLAKTGLACELFGFDPNLQRVRMVRASLASDVKALKNVMTGQKGFFKALKEGAKVAMAGRNFMDDAAYSLHMAVEGHSEAEVKAKIATLKDIALSNGAKETENSIPKLIRANPFMPLNNMLGPKGERWVPIHGIVSMSKGPECIAKLDALFAQMDAQFDKHEILVGYLITTLMTNGYLVEPVFIWPEEIFPLHEQSVEPSLAKKITRFAPNPDATAVVEDARARVLDIFTQCGAAHFQIGRTYPYAQTRKPDTLSLLKQIKSTVDPKSLVNPGSLGL